ncbi:MAG: hypothetical protein Q9224_003772 [Gallowayella concinna]
MSNSAKTPISQSKRKLQDAETGGKADHLSGDPAKKPKKSIESTVLHPGHVTSLRQTFSNWLEIHGTFPLVHGKIGFLDLPAVGLVYSRITVSTTFIPNDFTVKFMEGFHGVNTLGEAKAHQEYHDKEREPEGEFEYGDAGDESERRIHYEPWKVYGHHMPLPDGRGEQCIGPFSWNNHKNEVVGAISKIFTTDPEEIPNHIFGDFSRIFQTDSVAWEAKWDSLSDKLEGFFLPAFLRRIGSENAARIRTIVIRFEAITVAAKILPFYIEVFTQHCKELRELILNFDSEHGANYHSRRQSLAMRNFNQYVSVIDLCIWLRKALHNLPDLQQVAMIGAFPELRKMGEFIVDQKPKDGGYPAGYDFEEFSSFRREWLRMFKPAIERAIAVEEDIDACDVYLYGWPVEEYGFFY